MNVSNYKYYYFLGIGGIGMSALARYFRYLGKEVSGYDRTETALTKTLENEKIYIHYDDDISKIPEKVKYNPEETLVIYTPAISEDNICMEYLKRKNFMIIKRARILGEITRSKATIAVGGAHGKTTTSSMICHLLFKAGTGCYAMLGGISANYNTNFKFPKKKNNDIFVVEADEYDQSFLELSPETIVITSTDPDHLDIYGSPENVVDSYQEFLLRLKPYGAYFYREGIRLFPHDRICMSKNFGFSDSCQISARNIRIKNGNYRFDLYTPIQIIKDIHMKVPGEHNILNALATYAVADWLGIPSGIFVKAMETFSGVKRRFEYIINTEKQVYIDDYAHHPNELKASIDTLKKLYGDRKITAIFQPHLYSRTKDFATEFAKVLSVIDKVILMDIYPARELPIKGVSSSLIYDKLESPEKFLVSKDKLIGLLQKEATEIVVTFGAGDIDQMVEPVGNILSGKNK